ncbi:GAF domain-containing protein [Dactylosporangium sp. CA-139114]|uniref:GAF domain-containing protein n=1 Tax=Dactylosporangium sp. CA-139114 TaxID=3239931 RepID=UPI003D951F35
MTAPPAPIAPTGPQEDLRALFGPSTTLFATLAGPQHVLESANPAFLAAVGATAARPGMALADLVAEPGVQDLIAPLDAVYRTGESTTARDVRVRLEAGVQGSFDLTYEPRRDGDGTVTGVHVLGVETTQVQYAQRLMAEHRALLEQIARQAPLAEVLDGMASTIERLTPGDVIVSILLADPDGRHLRHGAAPSLPSFYNEAIDGIAIGEGVGSCGTAAHRRERVVVSDIATDQFWADFRDLATRAGLGACWSTPILARDGALLGTFAVYHRTARAPGEADLALTQVFADTAALAIERHHIESAKAAAEEAARVAHDALAEAVRAERELRADAERRAAAAAELTARMRTAAASQAVVPHPEHCQLGGASGCAAPAEIKVADSWGDSAWGCSAHVEEAIMNVRSVFIASEELGGLAAYRDR